MLQERKKLLANFLFFTSISQMKNPVCLFISYFNSFLFLFFLSHQYGKLKERERKFILVEVFTFYVIKIFRYLKNFMKHIIILKYLCLKQI